MFWTIFLKALKLQQQDKIPSLVPPNSLKPTCLQCSHDNIHIIVAISQHVFLVGRYQSARGEPEKERGSRSVPKKNLKLDHLSNNTILALTSGRCPEVHHGWRPLRPGRHCLGRAERTAPDAAFRDKWREVVTRWGVFQHSAYPPARTRVHRRLLLSACWPSMAYSPAPETPRPPSPYQNMEYSPFLLLCHHYHLHSNLSAAWDEWQGEGR